MHDYSLIKYLCILFYKLDIVSGVIQSQKIKIVTVRIKRTENRIIVCGIEKDYNNDQQDNVDEEENKDDGDTDEYDGDQDLDDEDVNSNGIDNDQPLATASRPETTHRSKHLHLMYLVFNTQFENKLHIFHNIFDSYTAF